MHQTNKFYLFINQYFSNKILIFKDLFDFFIFIIFSIYINEKKIDLRFAKNIRVSYFRIKTTREFVLRENSKRITLRKNVKCLKRVEK